MTNKLIGPKGSDVPEAKGKNELKCRDPLETLCLGMTSKPYKAEYTGCMASGMPTVVGGIAFTYQGKDAEGSALFSIQEEGSEKREIVCKVGAKAVLSANGGMVSYDNHNNPTLLNGGVSIVTEKAHDGAAVVTIKLE